MQRQLLDATLSIQPVALPGSRAELPVTHMPVRTRTFADCVLGYDIRYMIMVYVIRMFEFVKKSQEIAGNSVPPASKKGSRGRRARGKFPSHLVAPTSTQVGQTFGCTSWKAC
jgi:hypothetical protein